MITIQEPLKMISSEGTKTWFLPNHQYDYIDEEIRKVDVLNKCDECGWNIHYKVEIDDEDYWISSSYCVVSDIIIPESEQNTFNHLSDSNVNQKIYDFHSLYKKAFDIDIKETSYTPQYKDGIDPQIDTKDKNPGT